jgi:hypothetical protein
MAEWTMQDKGWWTSDLGGVADEGGRKWYFYPREGQERFGPFRTKKEAIDLAEHPARS